MEKNYNIKIKSKIKKRVKMLRIVTVLFFAVVGIIMFFYSIRYFIYLLMLMFILLFRLRINEKDNAGFIDAVCKVKYRLNSMNITIDSPYWSDTKIYSSEYNNIKFLDIDDDGKVEILFKNNDGLGKQRIEFYISHEDIEDWKLQKKEVENRAS